MLFSCLMFAQLKRHRSQPLHSPDFLTPSTQYKLGCYWVSYTKPTACANSKIQSVTHWPGESPTSACTSGLHHQHGNVTGVPPALPVTQDHNSAQISGTAPGYPGEREFLSLSITPASPKVLIPPKHHFHPHYCLWLTFALLPSVGRSMHHLPRATHPWSPYLPWYKDPFQAATWLHDHPKMLPHSLSDLNSHPEKEETPVPNNQYCRPPVRGHRKERGNSNRSGHLLMLNNKISTASAHCKWGEKKKGIRSCENTAPVKLPVLMSLTVSAD